MVQDRQGTCGVRQDAVIHGMAEGFPRTIKLDKAPLLSPCTGTKRFPDPMLCYCSYQVHLSEIGLLGIRNSTEHVMWVVSNHRAKLDQNHALLSLHLIQSSRFRLQFFPLKDRFNFPSSLLRSVTVFIETLNLDFRRNSLTAQKLTSRGEDNLQRERNESYPNTAPIRGCSRVINGSLVY